MFLQELFWLKIDTYYSNLNACHVFFWQNDDNIEV